MLDTLSAWVAAVWTALTFFVAANIEPMPGIWVAAVSGAMLSAFTGPDKGLTRMITHIFLAICVGVFASQILAELIILKAPQARVAEAFFCSLFSEKIVTGIHNGTILDKLLTAWRGTK